MCIKHIPHIYELKQDSTVLEKMGVGFLLLKIKKSTFVSTYFFLYQ